MLHYAGIFEIFYKNEMVPFKSCFMHYPQIPNFYLANLETHHFLWILTNP